MTEDDAAPSPPTKARLIAIDLDEGSIGRPSATIDHEREVAIFDILDGNSFALTGATTARTSSPSGSPGIGWCSRSAPKHRMRSSPTCCR